SILYIISGNRDFLLTKDFADATDATLLPDPTLLLWANRSAIITHGDLLCTDDLPYQKFREMVHAPAWQQQALAMPLAQRIQVAKQMRAQSEQSKQTNDYNIMDVNQDAVLNWFHTAEASRMIHGHTHRPQDHVLPDGQERIVLSDWDLDTEAEKQRAEILQWSVEEDLKRIPVKH
ncbi:MAG: UDP-2,3-diacylglucosamine diphosphatase, partial [Saezia sp.]